MRLLRESKQASDWETTRLFCIHICMYFFTQTLAYVKKKQYLCSRKGMKKYD